MGNQKTTHKSTYTMKNMSELYDNKELYEGTFTIALKTTDQYQQKYTSL